MTSTGASQRKRFWLRFVLVVGILFFASYLFLTATNPPFQHDDPKLKTMSLVQALRVAYVVYVEENGSLPKNLDNESFFKALSGENPTKGVYMSFKKIQFDSKNELIDSWGMPFRISYLSNSEVSIVSAGPDKIFGTSDDITNQ